MQWCLQGEIKKVKMAATRGCWNSAHICICTVCAMHIKNRQELQSHNCHLDFCFTILWGELCWCYQSKKYRQQKSYRVHDTCKKKKVQVQWPSDNDKVCYLRNRLVVMGLACHTCSWGKCLLQIPSAKEFWLVGSRKKILMLWALPSGIFSCRRWGPPKHSWPYAEPKNLTLLLGLGVSDW